MNQKEDIKMQTKMLVQVWLKKIKVYINTYSWIQYSIKSNSVFVDGNYNFPNLDEFNKSMDDLLKKLMKYLILADIMSKQKDVEAEEDPHMKLI